MEGKDGKITNWKTFILETTGGKCVFLEEKLNVIDNKFSETNLEYKDSCEKKDEKTFSCYFCEFKKL